MSEPREDPKLLSVVVPFYREGEVVDRFFEEALPALEELDVPLEVIAVDDGSDDDTFARLTRRALAHPHVSALRLSRNCGHQIALTAGLEHTSGDAVVVMDGDLQDPPELIGEMLARWREGLDVVYAVRSRRDGEGLLKRGPAKLFYRLLSMLSEIEIPLDTGDFRLMDRAIVSALAAHPERHRFLRGMVTQIGFAQGAVYFDRPPRVGGEPKYTLAKLIGLASSGIFSFSRKPLRIATWLGFGVSAMAACYLVWVMGRALFAGEGLTVGWASLMCTALFLGGAQLICLGLVGEYVGRIYDEVKQRPLYFVAERIGLEAPTA